MTTYAGVAQIVRFNWPWYAAALLATAGSIAALQWWIPAGIWHGAVVITVVLANGWMLLSLVVSHIIYDRSAVSRGDWLTRETAGNIVIVHAGHDEASPHVRRRCPEATCAIYDVFNSAWSMSPSLRRARAEGTHATRAASFSDARLAEASVDVVLLIFAAHEVRDSAARTQLFSELTRIIRQYGQIVVVEHLRDGWNLFAYGPGCLHFLSRRTWMRTFHQAGLRVARDDKLTPWVHRFELRKSA